MRHRRLVTDVPQNVPVFVGIWYHLTHGPWTRHISQPQTASRLIQPFLAQHIRVTNIETDRQTDTQTTLRSTPVAIGRICALHIGDAA